MKYTLFLLPLFIGSCGPMLPPKLAPDAVKNTIKVEVEGRTFALIPLAENDAWQVLPITGLNEGGGFWRPTKVSDYALSAKALEKGTGCSVDQNSIVKELSSIYASVICT